MKNGEARDPLRSKIDYLKLNNSKREEEKGKRKRKRRNSFGSKMECVREIMCGRVERKR